MPKTYYVLFAKDNNRWGVAFGDYERSTVQFERAEYRRQYKASELLILKTTDDAASIESLTKTLNGGK